MRLCRATLPSAECALDFIEQPGAKTFGGVVGTTAFRALLIAAGAYALGVRDRETLMKAAVGGAVGVELFVLAWVYMQKNGVVR